MSITLWDTATKRVAAMLQGHKGNIWSLAFSPDGKTLAAAGYDRAITLWDVTTGEQTLTLQGHRSGINALAFSPDNRLLASADWDGTVRLWRADSVASLAQAETQKDSTARR